MAITDGVTPRLVPTEGSVVTETESLCPDCVAEGRFEEMVVPMVVYEMDGEIRLAKECDEHGVVRDVYWSDADLYRRARSWQDGSDYLESTHVELNQESTGCPTNCGLCSRHRSHTALGNITVTNRCDLSCWYCFFYAEADEPIFEPTTEEIRDMVRVMTDEEPVGVNAIQLTGGEPTIREDIVEVVETVAEEVDYVQLNTHSLRLADDENLAAALSDAGVDVIYTSFDGVSPETNLKNFWEMPDALRTYREVGLAAVLVPTLIGGQNVEEVGDMIRFAAANADVVRGVNFQPVSFVGRMPEEKRREQRVTIPDAIHAIEQQTDGSIPADAWYPVPSVLPISELWETIDGEPIYALSNHFACGMATYVYLDGDELVPITDFVDVDPFLRAVRELADRFDGPLSDVQRTRLATRLSWELHQSIDRSEMPENLDVGHWLLDSLTGGAYDRLAEFHQQSIFLGMMHFMDAYNYDVERVQRCNIHYAMPDGRAVPFCAYNVLPELYRDRIVEENAVSVEELAERDYVSSAGTDDKGEPDSRNGPGIYGYDIKRRQATQNRNREATRETYRRSIEEFDQV